jgi:peroxiredoxin
VNDLPAMPITLLDGSTFSAKELKGKIILVLFQPDCDHCQHEATEIQANLPSFKNYTLYFISSSPPAENEKFATDYKLKGESNIHFGTTASENIINNFGPIQAPSVYIYSDQKLVKEFNGQVDVGVIIKYL